MVGGKDLTNHKTQRKVRFRLRAQALSKREKQSDGGLSQHEMVFNRFQCIETDERKDMSQDSSPRDPVSQAERDVVASVSKKGPKDNSSGTPMHRPRNQEKWPLYYVLNV